MLIAFNSLNRLLPMGRFEKAKSAMLRFSGLRVGDCVSIGRCAEFYGSNVSIGGGTWIGIGCRFFSSPTGPINIGEKCDLGPDVMIVTGSHKIGPVERRAGMGFCSKVTIESGVWLGSRVTVLAGAEICSGSVFGASALAIGIRYPGNCVYVGIPASVSRVIEP